MAESKPTLISTTEQPQYKKIVSVELHSLLPAACTSLPSTSQESDSKSSRIAADEQRQPKGNSSIVHPQLPSQDDSLEEDLSLNVHLRPIVSDSADANSNGRRSEDQMNEWIQQLMTNLQQRNAAHSQAVTIKSQNNRRNTLVLIRMKKGASLRDAGDILHFLTTVEDIEIIEQKGTFRLLPQSTAGAPKDIPEERVNTQPSQQPKDASQEQLRCIIQ